MICGLSSIRQTYTITTTSRRGRHASAFRMPGRSDPRGGGALSTKAELALDGAKASPIAVYLATILGGVDWGATAAMLAAIYSLILICEKIWKLVVQPLWRRFAQGPAS